jgi:hypothetical protein
MNWGWMNPGNILLGAKKWHSLRHFAVKHFVVHNSTSRRQKVTQFHKNFPKLSHKFFFEMVTKEYFNFVVCSLFHI